MKLRALFANTKLVHIFFVVAVLFSIVFAWIYNHHSDGSYNLRSFQSELFEKKHEAMDYSQKLLIDVSEGKPWWVVEMSLDDKPEGYDFLIYKNDSLVAWSDQVLSFRAEGLEQFDKEVVKLENTWCWVHAYNYDNYKLISLISIRKEYPYNNSFLHDEFTIDCQLYEECGISTTKENTELHLNDEDGTYLFSLKNCNVKSVVYAYLSIFFLVLCLILYFYLILQLIRKVELNSQRWTILNISIGFSLAIYLIHSYFSLPNILFETSLFSSIHFGLNSFLSNLGSLLYLSIIIYAHAFIFYKYINFGQASFASKIKWQRYSVLVVNISIGIAIWVLVNHIILEMFEHSSTATLVFKVTDMNIYGAVRIFITSLLWLSSLLVFERMIDSFKPHYTSRVQTITFCIIIIVSLGFCNNSLHYLIHAGGVVMFILLLWVKRRPNRHAYTTFIWFVFFFAAYAVSFFLVHNIYKERDERRLLIDNLAFRLILEEDPLSELLLKEKEYLIQNDSFLLAEVLKPNIDVTYIQQYLSQNYFDGYLSRYDLQIIPCWPGGKVRLTQNDSLYNCYDYFSNVIYNRGTQVLGSQQFYFLNSPVDVITYFGVFNYYSDTSNDVTLYLELVAKPFFEGAGYPELLLTERERKLKEPITHYSYGKYVNRELVKQTGSYVYSKEVLSLGKGIEDFYNYRYDGYDHMIFHPEPDVAIILSLPVVDVGMVLVAFSIFFIFYFVFGSLLITTTRIRRGHILRNLSIQERIQLSIISLMLMLLVAIAGGSVWQSMNRFKEKNHQILSEKTKSILMELDHKIGDELAISGDHELYLTTLLKKFSNVFYTDINMYSVEGRLLATSRPELYEKGLQSHLMNSAAFLAMKNNQENEFIQYENIGELEFLSAYVPFYNQENEILAYINMPYFIGTKEIKEEVSSLVMGILNFYLIFLIIVFALTVVISRRITYPLLVVQEKMSMLQLGVRSEKIEYKWNDEIGKLVREYNRMVDELADSAETLAQSQRELAWREMAQQIAHEIKNPLTPMKLSIQYLEMARNDGAADFDVKLKRVSSTLIDQIDKLSSIASEFSNFAKMPEAQREEMNVIDTLLQCVHLFDKEKKVVIKVHNKVGEEYSIYADPKQLISVFNNLLKNAIQAIPEKKDGEIGVYIVADNASITINIKDNGRGVPDAIKDKLFMPNFTTKSSGMGLGLAIVKNMVNINKGSIWFETTINVGSTFSVKFPKNTEGV